MPTATDPERSEPSAPGVAAVTRAERKARLKVLPASIALACLAAGLCLAIHYPVAPFVAGALFILSTALFFRLPSAWTLAVPALLPLVGFAPWTGWITFEESDMLVLAAAAGGYARLAWPAWALPSSRRQGPFPLVVMALVLLIASLVISTIRGVADAGGYTFGWYQAYREPMNSLRSLKSALCALLLLPLFLSVAMRGDPRRLALGLTLGLAAASLAALWERLAFTGLLNFSTDYRTTALFWEMHVGGAALDGFLAMTMPFALSEWLSASGRGRWATAAITMLLGIYACMTTFSRGVYAAVPVGLLAVLVLHRLQRRAAAPQSTSLLPDGLLQGFAIVVTFTLAAAWVFPTAGYRGMLALLLTAMVLMPLSTVLRSAKRGEWLGGICIGVVLAAAGTGLAWLIPKGPYVVQGASTLCAGSLLLFNKVRPSAASARRAAWLGLAVWLVMVASFVHVAGTWGGPRALPAAFASGGLLLLALPMLSAGIGPAIPRGLRWQATMSMILLVAAGVVAALDGGSYIKDRFATSAGDLNLREQHWRQSLSLLVTPSDWLLGRGAGRYFDDLWQNAAPDQRPGDFGVRLDERSERPYLALVAGTHVLGWGELLRVSQRVEPPVGPAYVQFDARASKPSTLHFEVCLKHLLYDGGCLVKDLKLAPTESQWQHFRLKLDGNPLTRGAWYAPKLVAFSVASEDSDHVTDISNIGLEGSDGRNLIANGDFSSAMARWYFTSDRYHLPWHMKNVAAHVLFEQGALGLALLAALWLGTIWRVTLGHARSHPLAPAIAGALLGFAMVGAFDSLLDVPRIAFLFYLLTMIGLTLRPPARSEHAAVSSSPAPGRAPPLAPVLLPMILGVALLASPPPAEAQAAQPPQTIEVGPNRPVKTLAEAARLAVDGALVLVDSGTYVGDAAVWTQNHLTLRAVGGRARMMAGGMSAEGKGTWVVRARDVRVTGFDFEDAAVPDRNGAGIRLESGSLFVRDCSFIRNEMGILTSNDPTVVLEIEDSEFGYNRRPDGHNHNLYVGTIQRLKVTGSYFHHAFQGHLLKSRAAFNDISYNRLTDEADGQASYELEFPNGGDARVIGNIIQQGPLTENFHIVSYGAEGYRWPVNRLVLSHNTLIDDRTTPGVFLRVSTGAKTSVTVTGNLLVGRSTWHVPEDTFFRDNVTVRRGDIDAHSFRLLHSPSAPGGASTDTTNGETDDLPTREYRHPHHTAALAAGVVLRPGAIQSPMP